MQIALGLNTIKIIIIGPVKPSVFLKWGKQFDNINSLANEQAPVVVNNTNICFNHLNDLIIYKYTLITLNFIFAFVVQIFITLLYFNFDSLSMFMQFLFLY